MLSYKFRIYPSRKQTKSLAKQLNTCKNAYNELREISIETYKNTGNHLTKFDLNNCIEYLETDISNTHSQVIQNINDRLSKAFQHFFRRLKEKQQGKRTKAGFPRFKNQYRSITYPQSGFKLNKKLHLSKTGNIPIISHRHIKGKIKTLTIKQNQANQWFAIFSCEVDGKPKKHTFLKKVGIDVGLEHFASLSDGTIIQNPRFLVKSEKKLARFQRRLNQKVKSSNNKKKAILRVSRIHNTITNQRTDFLHKKSRIITDKYTLIAVEKLNINGMVHNSHLAKHINDASWGNFIQMLSYKAWSAGSRFVEVNPRGTSQLCSSCGTRVSKTLSVRTHKCPFCGFTAKRDHNSAINILNRATVGRTGSHACGDRTSTPSGASSVAEAGTICDSSEFH